MLRRIHVSTTLVRVQLARHATRRPLSVRHSSNVPIQEQQQQQPLERAAATIDVDNNLWTKTSQRLLESEEPWSSSRRHEAMQVIRHSTSDRLSIALIDRLVNEEMELNDCDEADADAEIESEKEMLSDLITAIVANWRKMDVQRTMEPRELLEKVETYRNVGALHLSAQVYSMILDVAVAQGLPCATDLADDIVAIVTEQDMHDDAGFYPTAITAYARSDRPNSEMKAQSLLQLSLEHGSASIEAFTSTMTAWANSRHPDAPHRAEALLEQMSRTHVAKPDTYAFAAVLNAWAKSEDPNACFRALAILRHMSKLPGIKTNAVVYGTVMNAFAKQGKAVEAEELLNELMQKYEATQDKEYLPTVVEFSVVINAWSKSKDRDAAIRAEAVLETMQRLSQDRPELRPNKVSFNSVISAWARSGHPEAPERAEAIVNSMQCLYERTGNADIRPTAIALSTVIHAWSNSRRKGAALRAEAILNHMCHLYKEGDIEMKPDVHSFTTIMDVYAKTAQRKKGQTPAAGDVDVPLKLEEILVRMKESHGIQPNVYSYSVAIRGWSRHARSPSAAVKRAEELFAAVQHQYRSTGNEDCKPNTVLYNALLDAFARNGESAKALALFKEMEGLDDVDTQPDLITYNTVLNNLVKARDSESMKGAEELFRQMRQGLRVQPDNVSFCIIIDGLSGCNDQDALERIRVYFGDLRRCFEAGDRNCKPNVVTYTSVIRALAKLSKDRDLAAMQALHLLAEMQRGGEEPNRMTYRYVLECLSLARNQGFAAFELLKEMEDRKIEATDVWHLDHVLKACSWSSRDHGHQACQIAKQVYDRIRHPTATTFASMIILFAHDKTFVEHLYQECRHRQFHSKPSLSRIISKYAPFLLVENKTTVTQS